MIPRCFPQEEERNGAIIGRKSGVKEVFLTWKDDWHFCMLIGKIQVRRIVMQKREGNIVGDIEFVTGKMAFQRQLISEICEYFIFHGKRDSADTIEVMDLKERRLT